MIYDQFSWKKSMRRKYTSKKGKLGTLSLFRTAKSGYIYIVKKSYYIKQYQFAFKCKDKQLRFLKLVFNNNKKIEKILDQIIPWIEILQFGINEHVFKVGDIVENIYCIYNGEIEIRKDL